MTKANSPPCARSSPDRMAVPSLSRARVQTRATMSDLSVISPAVIPSTRGALAQAMPTSIEKPAERREAHAGGEGAVSRELEE